jgi:hypothetical protein
MPRAVNLLLVLVRRNQIFQNYVEVRIFCAKGNKNWSQEEIKKQLKIRGKLAAVKFRIFSVSAFKLKNTKFSTIILHIELLR